MILAWTSLHSKRWLEVEDEINQEFWDYEINGHICNLEIKWSIGFVFLVYELSGDSD